MKTYAIEVGVNTCIYTHGQPYQLVGRNCLGTMGPPPSIGNPLQTVVCQYKIIYNCGSHAKGDSQKFKIEEIEEL